MSESVRACFWIDTYAQSVAFDQFPDRFAAQSLACARDDEPRCIEGFAMGDESGARGLKILMDDFDRSFAEWNKTLLAPFALGHTVSFVESDIC
jgi:hypothetical protein